MRTRMNRKEVFASVQANIQNEDNIRQILVTESIMCALAKRLGKDVKEWGITGLLHDIDVELVEDDPSSHGRLGADIARELGANETIAHAILCHNAANGLPQETDLDKSLCCAISLSKLLISAISNQTGELSRLTAKAVINSTTNNEYFTLCQKLGLKKEELINLGIEAIKDIPPELKI